ncbi:APC family permease [Streptacidiphilus melanogenes]|uniref:APC family permease n=1 Tax=Streptacidiphilus melanogenes TaxID=411235 RepID=UPI000A05456F|nr:APC family permease [Streptacidiphilus melanogenes]
MSDSSARPHSRSGSSVTAAEAAPREPRLRRSLNVWQAVGLSMALMAPSMAVNINPQAAAPSVGRAVPLAFLIATVGVLLVAYVFVRLCQYFHHSGSVYAFVGATLGPRSGVVAGWGLIGTYLCYGVTTSSVVGIFGTSFLQRTGAWAHPPVDAPFILTGCVLVLSWWLTVASVRRGTNVLLTVEGVTVALILAISAVVLVRLVAGNAPAGHRFTMSVFTVPPGTAPSALFLGVVFGFLSFAGFEAAATLGEEANEPRRDIPRAILGTTLFGGVFFVVVTGIEMMGFGANTAGVKAFGGSASLIGDLGGAYLSPWVGDAVTLGATVSAFGCCLACTVGAARLLFALGRDSLGDRGPGRVSRSGTPAWAATAVSLAMALVLGICVVAFSAVPEDTFVWGSTVGTLILLVAYVLTTLGAIRLVFVQRRMPVPMWQVVIPVGALAVLGYTVYRNVIPYPASGPGHWFPIVAGGWLAAATLAVCAAPTTARRLGHHLTHAEGLRGHAPAPPPEPGG